MKSLLALYSRALPLDRRGGGKTLRFARLPRGRIARAPLKGANRPFSVSFPSRFSEKMLIHSRPDSVRALMTIISSCFVLPLWALPDRS
jgi:hypothetical protein